MKRQFVHLAADSETAMKVGKRWDKQPIFLKIEARTAFREGVLFYEANKGVCLVKETDSQYIEFRIFTKSRGSTSL